MKTLTTSTIVLAIGFATVIGCGSDSGGKSDAPVIGGGTGGSARADANGAGGALGTGGAVGTGGVLGTGGAPTPDAPLATGGSSGGHDGGVLDGNPGVDSAASDSPLVIIDGGVSEAGGEVATTPNICTGLSATACDLAIRNAATDNTVVAQDVPVISATSYPACSQ